VTAVVAADPPRGGRGLEQRDRDEQRADHDVPADQAAHVEQSHQLNRDQDKQQQACPRGDSRVAGRSSGRGEHGVRAVTPSGRHVDDIGDRV
jgi:hypothetical protein